MRKIIFPLIILILWILVLSSFAQERPEVLLRLDDIGMNHSVNMAVEQVSKTGIPFSATIMFACPWYQEAVDILKKYPNADIGIHLTLTSEWRYYRWGPILGKSGVPSLVDSLGYFFENEEQFLKSNYTLTDVEKELTAQIERALKSGLKITFMDPHMGVSLLTPELRGVTEKLAKKYNLAISGLHRNYRYGESFKDMWAIPVENKKQEFLKHLGNLEPGSPNLIILHIARQDPEMEVLEMNEFLKKQNGKPMAAQHRQAELDMLLSPEFQGMVGKDFKLITYADLVKRKE